ncbi:MAG: PIG-L deacetylase family protein [Pseudonocardiaceae bacterium]
MRRIFAVSPHLDDAALSAGATLADFAARGVDVEVLTLFAGSPREGLSEIARGFHAKCGLPLDASAVAARRDEDRAAMRELGAATHHGEFPDAIYRRDPQGNWLCAHERAIFDDLPPRPGRSAHRGHPRGPRHPQWQQPGPDPDLRRCRRPRRPPLDQRRRPRRRRGHRDTDLAVGGSSLRRRSTTRDHAAPNPTHPSRSMGPEVARHHVLPTQVRMLWPTGTDWAAQLLAHAQTRGHGHPAELLLPPSEPSRSTSSAGRPFEGPYGPRY